MPHIKIMFISKLYFFTTIFSPRLIKRLFKFIMLLIAPLCDIFYDILMGDYVSNELTHSFPGCALILYKWPSMYSGLSKPQLRCESETLSMYAEERRHSLPRCCV